jgi:hypothetical protein
MTLTRLIGIPVSRELPPLFERVLLYSGLTGWQTGYLEFFDGENSHWQFDNFPSVHNEKIEKIGSKITSWHLLPEDFEVL